jgi:hypothetical protein
MSDDELWDRIATLEVSLDQAPNVHAERHIWKEIFSLLHEAGHDDQVQVLKDSLKYRKFEVREAWQFVITPIILGLPRPIKWLIRRLSRRERHKE